MGLYLNHPIMRMLWGHRGRSKIKKEYVDITFFIGLLIWPYKYVIDFDPSKVIILCLWRIFWNLFFHFKIYSWKRNWKDGIKNPVYYRQVIDRCEGGIHTSVICSFHIPTIWQNYNQSVYCVVYALTWRTSYKDIDLTFSISFLIQLHK